MLILHAPRFVSSKAIRELQYNASIPVSTLVRECVHWLKEQQLL